MLKLYTAYGNQGKVEIRDGVTFKNGIYSPWEGYGDIHSGYLNINGNINYDIRSLKEFKDYVKNLEFSDGYVQDFRLHVVTDEELKILESTILKNELSYKKQRLNEEAVLLLTDWVTIDYINNELIERILGRYNECGMYLIKPNATFTMSFPNSDSEKEHYEVLQSKSLGTELQLVKTRRFR